MAVSTLPLSYELTIYSGTTFRREFRWLPDGQEPQDFTGWSASMLIGNPGGTAITALTTNNTGVVLTSTGQIILSMPPLLTGALKPGVWAYALDLTDPQDVITRFMRGRVNLVMDVKA